MTEKTTYRTISVAAALLFWQLLAMKLKNGMLLASPLQVLTRLSELIREPGFLPTVLYSFGRISLGFILAFFLGLVLGILSGRFKIIEQILWPYVITFKSVPVASFIILFLIWMNFSALTVLIAFLIAFPAIYSNVLQGVRSTDRKMTDMAKVYRLPWYRRLVYIYMPSVKPYLISSSGVVIGMAWKAGVAAEVIGIVDGSVGEMLYTAKVYFQNADLLCWTVMIILVSVLSEKVFVFALREIFKGVEKA